MFCQRFANDLHNDLGDPDLTGIDECRSVRLAQMKLRKMNDLIGRKS